MHASISQPLAAERIREWQQSAARDRLARQAAPRRHETLGPAGGWLRQRRHPAAKHPAAEQPAAEQVAAVPPAVTEEHAAAADDRQPARSQAA